MAIWKCAWGGYHSDRSCNEKYMSSTKGKTDVQMVRVPDRNELLAALSRRYAQQFFDEDVDAVLETLVHLTPDGKDTAAWKTLHQGSST